MEKESLERMQGESDVDYDNRVKMESAGKDAGTDTAHPGPHPKTTPGDGTIHDRGGVPFITPNTPNDPRKKA